MSKKKDKRKRKGRRALHSTIQQHKRIGKELVPPLNAMDKISLSSWRDDHAPEMLWAFLVAAVLPRKDCFNIFRRIARWAQDNFSFNEKDTDEGPGAPLPPPENMPNMVCEVDHTSIAEFTDWQFEQFINLIAQHPLGYGALRPLLFLDALPGIERWRSVLDVEPMNEDWFTLADAVAHSFDHQSEKSTDIRWLKIVVKMVCGKMKFPREMRLRVEEVLDFSDKGDMHIVRPFIRAGEMNFRRHPTSEWIARFWAQLMAQTGCLDGSTEQDYSELGPQMLSLRTILDLRSAVTGRFHKLK